MKNEILMSEGIICAVEIHRQAMKLVCPQYTKNMFNNIFLFLKIIQSFGIYIRDNGVLFNSIWSGLLKPKSVSSKFSVSYCNI